MATKITIGIGLAIMTAAVFFIMKVGYKPAPTGIMKPSFFSEPEEIGAVVFRRFYVPISERKVVVFGIPPQPAYHQKIVRGFLAAAAKEKHPFEVLITEQDMPELDLTGLPEMNRIALRSNTPSQAELIDELQKNSEKRILFYTASTLSTHLLEGNPVTRLEKTMGTRYISFTSGPLALHPTQEYIVQPVCVGSERDPFGVSVLGCAIVKSGRMHYRKQVPQDRWVAIMNEQGMSDYLLMVSEPGQDQRARESASVNIEK